MLVYLCNALSECTINLEKLESIIAKRFSMYNSFDLQYDTEEFKKYDKIAQLVMSFIAFDYSVFNEFFLQGESKLFINKLEKKRLLEIKEELSTLLLNLKYLSQQEEVVEFDKKNFKYLLLVICTTEKLIENADHIFSKNHSKDCTELKMLLPFTFAVDLVSKRKVEVRNGKIIVYCPLWSKILEVIFKYFLNLEMKLLMKCKVLKEVIYNLEDDRIRQIIKRFTNMLKGTMSKEIKVPVHRGSINILSQLFPPCMANLHQILRRTHRLSYESRYQYTLFLRDIGMPVNENILFWKSEYKKPHEGSSCIHKWIDKENRYIWQIEHVYELVGKAQGKSSHSCKKFIEELQPKMDGGCPFQHLSAEGLREFIPQKMAELPDIEDVFKFKNFGLPQRACAVYLSCHQKFFKNRENRFVVSNADVKTVPLIISPLQYYNISKQILEN